MIANFVILVLTILTGSITATLIAVVALLGSGWMCAKSYQLTRRCVTRSCQLRGQTLAPLKHRRFLGVLGTVAMTHLIYGFSCVRAIFVRRISWREITYELKSSNKIKRLNYAPYLPKSAGSDVSI